MLPEIVIATVLALLLALCPQPAPTDRADRLLAASEQQGQAQRPLNTPMPAPGQHQEQP